MTRSDCFPLNNDGKFLVAYFGNDIHTNIPRFKCCKIMAALACCNCERPATCSCVCCFPLPLLCQEHRLTHSTDSHFHLPVNAVRHVQNIETQTQLNEQVTKLRKQLSLINLYNDPQQQPSIDIRDALMHLYKDMRELKIKVNEFKADIVPNEEVKNEWNIEGTVDVLTSMVWNENIPESEFSTWIEIAHGLILKGEFQYEESCRVLERQWKLVQTNKGVEVLVLGLVVGEVMGLHIGRFEEALAVIEKSLEVADELYPKSEIALQLSNIKAAILINFSDSEENSDICMKAVLRFRDASTSEVSFGTALYFCTTAHLLYDRELNSEIRTLIEEWKTKTEDSCNNLIKHIRLYQNALLKMMDHDNNAAEDLLQQAEELAKQYFPTSIFAALCWFMNVLLMYQTHEFQDGAVSPDDECLRIHFPASILRALILAAKAQRYNCMEETDKEFEIRLSIHLLLQVNPNCEIFSYNIASLAAEYKRSGNDQAALDIRESAYNILFERSFASPAFLSFQSDMRNLYQSLNLPEKEFELYVKTVRKIQESNLLSFDFDPLFYILKDWRKDSQREKATQLCLELYQFLLDKCPDSISYYNAVGTVADMYLEQDQEEKAADIVLEGIQVAKKYHLFYRYVRLTSILLSFSRYKSAEKQKLEILHETHHFLMSNGSFANVETSDSIKSIFFHQPEMLLEIFIEIYHALQASPTTQVFNEYLNALTKIYDKERQHDKVIETRLEAHRLLLDQATCENFLSNVDHLANYYWNIKRREESLAFRLEVHRILLPDHSSRNFLSNLYAIEDCCRTMKKLPVALEPFSEAYRLLQLTSCPESEKVEQRLCFLYCDTGNPEAAVQIAQNSAGCVLSSTSEYSSSMYLLRMIYTRTGQIEKAVDLYLNALMSWPANRYDENMRNCLYSLNELMEKSEQRNSVIETYLELIHNLIKAGLESVYPLTFGYLEGICLNARDLEEVKIKKKILMLILLSYSHQFNTVRIVEHIAVGPSMRPDCGKIAIRIGGLYAAENRKEVAEVYLAKAAVLGGSRFFSPNSKEIRETLRTFYNGYQWKVR